MKTVYFISMMAMSLIATQLSAAPITITDNYIGSENHGMGDVIGAASIFNTHSMEVELVGSSLELKINTNFAGNAGVYSRYVTNGIGYGDLFLGSAWDPYGDAPYLGDNHATGTRWTYGLALDNNWNNRGGAATLYALNGPDNNSTALLAEDLMGTRVTFRNGQEVMVDRNSQHAVAQQNLANWSVNKRKDYILMSVDLSATSLLLGDKIALHWGPTCGNDVIEGIYTLPTSSVPEPPVFLLMGLGLVGLLVQRRMKRA